MTLPMKVGPFVVEEYMIKGNLYFIKDEFFDKFPNQMLLTNKPDAEEYNMNRPCYYAFPDEEDERILWMVPVSSQIEKFEKKYNRSIEKYGQCDVLDLDMLRVIKMYLVSKICFL